MGKFKNMSLELEGKLKNLVAEMTSKLEAIQGDMMKMFVRVEKLAQNVQVTFLKRVAVVENMMKVQLNNAKKMTIQQTVDLLTKVPLELKSLTEMTIKEFVGKLVELKNTLNKELRTYMKKVDEVYASLKKTIAAESVRVEALLKQLKLKVRQVIKTLRPYVADVQQMAYKVQGEVVDTALFVYNYYNLGEKFDKLKKFLIEEIMKIVEQAKTQLPVWEKMIAQYVQDYRHQLQMSTQQYTSVAKGYARDAQDFTMTTYESLRTDSKKTGDEILRSIHKGLVYLDTVDKEVLMSKLQELVDFIKKHITIIQKEGQVIVKMIHPNLRPTFNHYTNVVKTQAQVDRAILTFDGKLYDMVAFPKMKKGSPSPCSYLLARDFQDKKFTISKLDNAIIVETPQMAVKIRNDGQTKTTIGNAMKFGLPVESGKSSCVRVDNLIMCHFKEQALKVTVDLKNFFTSISVSGWYKGKSQGLLGTLNNEVSDDWRLPNKMITTNINEFLNAYELPGKSVCKLNPKADNVKQCTGKTSKMCAAYFDAEATTPSPFAKFFKEADPKPFMEACVRETKCKRMNKKAHCGVVAAYNALLRTKGFWTPQANECMMEKGRAINEVWTQKSTKMIDIVVMVSQHVNMNKMKRSIASTMLVLHTTRRSSSCLVKPTLLSSSSIPSLSRSSATARRWAVSSVRQPTSCTLPTT